MRVYERPAKANGILPPVRYLRGMPTNTISVIIPCLNEEKHIHKLLDFLRNNRGRSQVIVVDGGSSDATIPLVSNYPFVETIETNVANRAHQMNAGATIATGETLLFLHADTLPPRDFEQLILEAMQSGGNVGGAFYLRFDHKHWMFSMMTFLTRLNIPWITVGDHGLFFRKEVFESLGGFPDIPLLEDLELQLKARRQGKMVRIQAPVLTSARRFLNNGVLSQTLKDARILLSYFLGTPPENLAKLYSNNSEVAR